MFKSTQSLPHLLPAKSYYGQEEFQEEREHVLRNAWHLVGTTQDLKTPGDFVTSILVGTPIQVRNFNGRIVALSNICAHRHSLLSAQQRGNSERMQCQYHGWEYQADGTTGRIPQPKNFVPLDRERLCLENYPLIQIGQLLFVSVGDQPVLKDHWLDGEMQQLIEDRFGGGWFETLNWSPGYAANWKVPIENSLESYHVPNVHPGTFREDPGADRSDHELYTLRTAMTTGLPFSPHSKLDAMFQRFESRFIAWLGYPVTGRYWQHHVFPNLLFSFTDAISLVSCIVPDSATTSTAVVRQFGRLPASSAATFGKRLLARAWGKLAAGITRRILLEDQVIFQDIQSGLEASRKQGVLGICEERIHAFQDFMVTKSRISPSNGAATND